MKIIFNSIFRLVNMNFILEKFENCFIDCHKSRFIRNIVLNEIKKCQLPVSSSNEKVALHRDLHSGDRFTMVVSYVLQVVST